MPSYIALVLSLVGIFIGAAIFTNAIEWLGRRLDLSHGATGSLMAAMGTALPEAMIPILAIAFGSGLAKQEIGVGAILGAPLLLATLALFISGMATLYFAARRRRGPFIQVDAGTVEHDLLFFVVVYALAAVAGLLPWAAGRWAIGGLLVVLYGGYAWFTLRRSSAAPVAAAKEGHPEAWGPAGEAPGTEPLFLQRGRARPALWAVLVQVALGLAAIVYAAHVFVGAVQDVSASWGVSAFLLSVVITPIATELPETFNSVIWLGQRKDTLAMSNISGAMVFQASLIPAIGILFTPWNLQADQLWAVALAIAAALLVLVSQFWKGRILPLVLACNGLLYLVYLLIVL